MFKDYNVVCYACAIAIVILMLTTFMCKQKLPVSFSYPSNIDANPIQWFGKEGLGLTKLAS